MSAPGTLAWIGGHELRLAWRDFAAMVTAGRPRRARAVVVAVVLFAALMHLVAYGVIASGGRIISLADKTSLVVLGATGGLFFALMLSQALESVTRAFYARSDLDLLLSSPVSATRVFAVRIVAVAVAVAGMGILIAGPFVDVLALTQGLAWLAAYPVVVAAGATAAGISVAAAAGLFRLIGPRRTRAVAQVIAAIVGAAFVIGVQVASILSFGELSRYAWLGSAEVVAGAPEPGNALWIPVRAAAGDPLALAIVVVVAVAALAGAILMFAPGFAGHVAAAAAVGETDRSTGRRRAFAPASSPAAALRRKEWALLRRDPWLLSNTLMQLLYLLPPALLLWRNFGSDAGALAVMVPVLVMAAGQLAGGLAWLTISGEDAPDLVATAPVAAGTALRAKVEAVIGAVLLIVGPLALAMALAAPWQAAIAAVGIALAALQATAIQMIFRTRSRRSQFRRRQTASRVATFAEAFSSIAWAASAALAAMGTWAALAPAVFALMVLAGARALGPARPADG